MNRLKIQQARSAAASALIVASTFVASTFATPAALCAQSVLEKADLNVTADRVRNADTEPGNWLAHGRTFGEQRYSPLDSINEGNVGELGLAWAVETGLRRGHEASPIVVDGAMFLTLPWSGVLALDAATGEKLWSYDPEVPREAGRNACCDVVNRGAAVWKGNVYSATIDGRLIALNAKTGGVVWEKQTTPTDKPYTITGAPRIVKDKVIIGNGGAEYGVRGFITAYDAETGEQAWRFYTVPGNPADPFEHPELEPAAKTWTGEWWQYGGGGTAWDSMAFDPELDTLYVGTGNGSPWNRAVRSPGGGDNLYLSSILALDPETGRLKWHYQTTPADTWDYTATQHLILAELEIEGRERHVIMQAPKNGFFYVLDRETGELLSAKNYVDTTWASHVDMATGRPVETGKGDWKSGPKVVFPSPTGGHNWQPMAFNPKTGLVYIPALSESFPFIPEKKFEYNKLTWNTGVDFPGLVKMAAMGGAPPAAIGMIKAWDPVAGREVWNLEHPTTANGGMLTTAGNLLFQGNGQGTFAAYRADTGERLWETMTHIGMVAPPVTYTVGGEQYVTVVAGWGGVPAIIGADMMTAASVTHANNGHVLTFKLNGKGEMPAVAARRTMLVPEPPDVGTDSKTDKLGEEIFHKHCFQCHGLMAVSSGVISDLRYSSSAVHRNFEKIVLEGALLKTGMPSFADTIDADAVKAVHGYITKRARDDRKAMLKAMEKQEDSAAN